MSAPALVTYRPAHVGALQAHATPADLQPAVRAARWIVPATRDVRPHDRHLVPEGDGGLSRDFTTQLLRR